MVDDRPTLEEGLPHRHLYTRLRPSSGTGIGVFAIRAIPEGVNPFEGEGTGAVRVPVATVERIEDAEQRRFYTDFCPVIDGCFLAPSDFNRMTIAWYMNHSETPNVVAGPDVVFIAARAIRKDEELTVDYRTFSDRADHYMRAWPGPA